MEWTPADEMRMIAACRASRGAASVAQLDRVLPSEGRGRGFESRRMRQIAVSACLQQSTKHPEKPALCGLSCFKLYLLVYA